MNKPLSMFTIYDSPKDYPAGTFVVRRWEIRSGCPEPVPMEETTHKTLEEARASMPKNLFRTIRAEHDDPTILETWL